MKIYVVNRTVLEKLRDEHGIVFTPGPWGTEEAEIGLFRLQSNPNIPEDTVFVVDDALLLTFYNETEAAQ